jgi:hypothetical protein
MQLNLTGKPDLTDRQELALELIDREGPISSLDLGRRMREIRRHPFSDRFDLSSGQEVAQALRKRGLVRKARPLGWVVAEWTPEPQPSSQNAGEIPF